MAMRRIFWGFCDNRFLMSPLQYVSSRSDFGFEFAEIFIIEKVSPTRRVARFSITNISANSKPKSERLEM